MDDEAFEQIYRRYAGPIRGFVLRKLRDRGEAEDVTQEVFEAVYSGIAGFQGRSELRVWIYGIARNIANNRLRRRAALRVVSLDLAAPEAAPAGQGPCARAEAREALRSIRGALARLPGDQRRMLELRCAEHLGIRRIAALMNRSEDAVKSGLYRARRSLARSLR